MIVIYTILIMGGLLFASLSLFPLVHEAWLTNEKPLDKAMRTMKGGKG